jgi:hypothetical protein
VTISDPENTPSDYSRNRNRYRHENSIYSVDSNLDRVISVGCSQGQMPRGLIDENLDLLFESNISTY